MQACAAPGKDGARIGNEGKYSMKKMENYQTFHQAHFLAEFLSVVCWKNRKMFNFVFINLILAMFKLKPGHMQLVKSSTKPLNRNYEIKCSLLTAATISGNWEISGIWNSIKKLLSCGGRYLHNPLERSEQQEASFDVSGRCQITALLKTAHCAALTSGDLLKWPVWLKVVNSKREVHKWVAIWIFSKTPPITRLKEKLTLIFQVLLSLK